MSKTETSPQTLREYKISNLVKETITLALFEQKLLKEEGELPPPGQAVGPVPPAPQTPPAEQNQQQPPQTGQNPGAEPLTVDSMIERLNVIRGGRSFTDPEIYGQFTTYFKQLQPEQLETIDSFLQNLSKIVVNVEQTPQQQGNQDNAPPPAASNNGGTQPPVNAGPPVAGGPVPGGPMG